MPDLNSDALGIWEHLKPAIDKEIEQKTRGMVQRRKMKVTTAPSIATGKIGVTEAFGTTEMAIPFATNLISATVGDMVWVEFMYGATNAFASMFASADEKDWDVAGDLTVHGVLDVTQRRCYGTLSSAGWYRVCELQYTSGSILDLSIGINSTLARKITLMFPSVALAKFVDETSVSTANNVFDKIRFTGIGGSTQKCYVDLHYTASSATNVSVFWTPTGNWTNSCVSKNLQSVADSPSGETELTRYTFAANTEYTRYIWTPTFSGTANPSVNATLCFYSVKNGVLYAGGRFNLASFTSGGTTVSFTLPVSLGSADRSAETIGTMFTTTKTLQLRWTGSTVYITDAGGNFSGYLLNTGYWSFQIVAPIYN